MGKYELHARQQGIGLPGWGFLICYITASASSHSKRRLSIDEPEGTSYYEDGLRERIAKQAKGNDADVT